MKHLRKDCLITLLKHHEINTSQVVDLFSGCGGLALGFQKQGFEITTGIELIESARLTANYNLHWKHQHNGEHIAGDIKNIHSAEIDKHLKSRPIVIGGPPCQAYSIAGRAKLRSLGDERKHSNDARGHLYQDFLRFVEELDANAVVMENVPESTNYNEQNIPEIVCERLVELGYTAYWTILNAADYGVPQTRERVFVIALKRKLTNELPLPIPTNRAYNTTNRRIRKFTSRYYREPNSPREDLPPWVTVKEAISDLPELFPTFNSNYKLNKLNMLLPYKTGPLNRYQELMRQNVNPYDYVTGHAYRKTPRDFEIFSKMKQGDNYLEAHRIAVELFNEEYKRLDLKEDTESYYKLQKKLVPPYSVEKFTSKWLKLREDQPSHTLVAHLSVDTYSHIHPWEPRGISVREAARLQSFPDDFIFNCAMSDAFKQIGNAVPPLLSEAIARTIRPFFE